MTWPQGKSLNNNNLEINMKKIIFILFPLLISPGVFGQPGIRQSSHQTHGWLMYFGNHRISNKLSLHTEYQWRRADGFKNWQQSLARIGFDYRIKDNTIVTAGYGHIITFPYGDFPVPTSFVEHRTWEQLILTHSNGRVHFNHRYRLEQRWQENMIKDVEGKFVRDGHLYSNRMRYKFMVTVPINSTKMEVGTFFASVYDEPFISFGKNVKYNLLDQNRLYAAIGYQFHKTGNIQAGYLNQIIIKPLGNRQEINHTIQIGLTWSMDWRKKQHA
jgi:hypothetical protein